MRVFKISTKFEQNQTWSKRNADVEGYFIKPHDEDEIIEGYVKMMYPTCSEPLRYIKGLYSNDSLIFMQMCNDPSLSPICYCFPNVNQEGFWSSFHYAFGFFPCHHGVPCSQGHATLVLEDITDSSIAKNIAQGTAEIFSRETIATPTINRMLLDDAESLKDFMDEGFIFQMRLHCGKW